MASRSAAARSRCVRGHRGRVARCGLRFTEVRLGIIPAVISPFVAPRIGAAARATSSPASASELTGSANRARVRSSEDRGSGPSLRAGFLAGGPVAVREAKKLVRERPTGEATAHIAAARRTSDEGQDGLRAFLERRSAGWLEPGGSSGARGARSCLTLRRVRLCRSGDCSSRTGERSPCGSSARVCARDRDGRRRGARRSRRAPRPFRGRWLKSRATSTRRSTCARRSKRAPTPCIPATAFSQRTPSFAEAVDAAGLTWVGPPPEALRLGGDKLAAKRIARRGGRPGTPRRNAGGDRLSAARQGGGGRRRPRDARRALVRRLGTRSRRPSARRRAPSATGRSSASATSSGHATSRSSSSRTRMEPSSRSASATAPCSGDTRRCSRSRRLPASTPALRGRSTRRRSRSRRRSAIASAGTAEFVLDGRRLLLPRAQRPDPGRASGHGGCHRPRPGRAAAPRRGRRGARIDGHVEGIAVEVRLYAEDPRTFLPQAGRIERLSLPTARPCRRGRRGGRRGRRRLRPDDREADRARRDAR